MKLLKTKTQVDNLSELKRRKAELKTRLEREQADLRASWQEVRSDLRPSQLASSFAQSLLGLSEPPGPVATGVANSLRGPLHVATDLLVGNTRARVLLKIVAPLLLAYLPNLFKKAKGVSLRSSKAKLYGALRSGVADLRSQLKRKKTDTPNETEDIIQPS
ncbi:MAG: hypothetical protein KIS77_11805 [Saprospiraceae bacterium]|nr:hypothetical protein [Saprospiraceae bacterium]